MGIMSCGHVDPFIECCIQYIIWPAGEDGMTVRLNITIDEAVYARLKKEVRPKRISAFISEAVRAKLRPDPQALDAAYKAASKERWRRRLADEWSRTDTEGWPE
jgi:hypothetical protein